MNIGIAALVFGVIFLAELPDKSMIATLVLSTRYRPFYVWLGAAAAFLAHVLIAVLAGQLLTLLPHRLVEAIVTLLFLAGAAILFFSHGESSEETDKTAIAKAHGFVKIFSTAFGVIFIGEWGDITQIATANYAAHYHDPFSVGIGAVLGLWAVAGLAVVAGKKVLKRLPGSLLHRIIATVMLLFAIISAYQAVRG